MREHSETLPYKVIHRNRSSFFNQQEKFPSLCLPDVLLQHEMQSSKDGPASQARQWRSSLRYFVMQR